MQATTVEPVTRLATAAHAEGGVSGCACVRACAHESLTPPTESRRPSRTSDSRGHQQQLISQPLLLPDRVPTSFQPGVPRTPEVLLPRLRRAEAVRAEATGSSSAPTVSVKRPGGAGAVRLRRSCGRGVGRGPVPEDGGGGGELGVSGQSSGFLVGPTFRQDVPLKHWSASLHSSPFPLGSHILFYGLGLLNL